MALASDLPPDMAAALAGEPSYPDLFQAAFGSPEISARRIAFAIATYERTLVPNQTPWDAFTAGQPNAMTPQQIQGWNVFNNPASRCNQCHTPPVFSNQTFRNIGLRPTAEDTGRQVVTGNPADRGRFKVPSLRNVGLRSRFFHTGNVGPAMGSPANTLEAVVGFYQRGGDFPDNRDPLMNQANVAPQLVPALVEFLENGLTDPRVANELFPFDRPTLHSESALPNPRVFGSGVPGGGGIVPRILALSPPSLTTPGFRIGIASARGGALARLGLVPSAPAPGAATTPADARHRLMIDLGFVVLDGDGDGAGFGTLHVDLADLPPGVGPTFSVQWMVFDPAAPGGVARSRLVELSLL
jgi:hypothetical protein